MKIIFYKTQSESNRLDKLLTDSVEIEGNFKSEVDIINPVITLSTADVMNHNYCFIPTLNRYYFVNHTEITRTSLITITLAVDVLMSYNQQIKDLYVIVDKTENGNPYNTSNSPAVDIRTDVETIELENNFNELGEIVMVTI